MGGDLYPFRRAVHALRVFRTRCPEAAADPAKAESDSSVYYSPNDAASQETDRESAANSANFKEYETFFTVRAYNDSVAVFKDGNDVPLYCIETPLSSLTEEDRRLLARGIRAETLSEACKLIEDYE